LRFVRTRPLRVRRIHLRARCKGASLASNNAGTNTWFDRSGPGNAEIRITDPEDRATVILFGDGAGQAAACFAAAQSTGAPVLPSPWHRPSAPFANGSAPGLDRRSPPGRRWADTVHRRSRLRPAAPHEQNAGRRKVFPPAPGCAPIPLGSQSAGHVWNGREFSETTDVCVSPFFLPTQAICSIIEAGGQERPAFSSPSANGHTKTSRATTETVRRRPDSPLLGAF